MKKIMLATSIWFAMLSMNTGLYAFADPNAYHWKGQQQFFEGWYFKVSDPDTGKSFLFIYAVFNPDGASPESCGFMMAGHPMSNSTPASARKTRPGATGTHFMPGAAPLTVRTFARGASISRWLNGGTTPWAGWRGCPTCRPTGTWGR